MRTAWRSRQQPVETPAETGRADRVARMVRGIDAQPVDLRAASRRQVRMHVGEHGDARSWRPGGEACKESCPAPERDDTGHDLAKEWLLGCVGLGHRRRALTGDHALRGIRLRGIGFRLRDRVGTRLHARRVGGRARRLLELLLRDPERLRDCGIALDAHPRFAVWSPPPDRT